MTVQSTPDIPLLSITTQDNSYSSIEPETAENTSTMKSRMKDIAVRSFFDLAVAALLVGVTMGFADIQVAQSSITHPIMTTSLLVGLMMISRCVSQFALNPTRTGLKRAIDHMRAILFLVIDLSTREIIWHESGHKRTCDLLFENSPSQITMIPFSQAWGFTECDINQELTSLGRSLGLENAEQVMIAAGPGAAVAWNHIALIVAHICRNKLPEFSRYARWAVTGSVIHHTYYASSAYFTPFPGHDFVNLEKTIAPWASALVMASPILTQLIASLMSKFCCQRPA